MTERQMPPASIEDYIARFPPEIQEVLEKIRATIRAAAPEAQEKISYQMPTFALKGNLVHFAAWKTHIGFYPAPSGIVAFQKELKEYALSKGAIQFPLGRPIPYDLIRRIVQVRVAENLSRAQAKGGKD